MKKLLMFIVISIMAMGETGETDFNMKEKENNLSNEKLMFQYEMNKKEPWGAVAGTFLLPSVGHAYAGNWGRGLKFLSGEILALVLMANASSDNVEKYQYSNGHVYFIGEEGTDNDWLIGVGAIALISLRIWEHIDAYKTAKNYNSNLYRSLIINPVVSPNTKSIGMSVGYSF